MAIAALAAACTWRNEATATPTVASTSVIVPATPTPTPRPTAGGTRAAVPAGVDAISKAVVARDIARLEQLVLLTPVPCGPPQGPGSPPPCPARQPAGTPIEVLPMMGCDPEFRAAAAVRGTLQPLIEGAPKLFGVYRAPDQYLPPVRGEYVAVFSRQPAGAPRPLGAGVIIAGDRIVGIWYGCQADPTGIVPPGTPPVLLPGF